jgi:hypothetical protein
MTRAARRDGVTAPGAMVPWRDGAVPWQDGAVVRQAQWPGSAVAQDGTVARRRRARVSRA